MVLYQSFPIYWLEGERGEIYNNGGIILVTKLFRRCMIVLGKREKFILLLIWLIYLFIIVYYWLFYFALYTNHLQVKNVLKRQIDIQTF